MSNGDGTVPTFVNSLLKVIGDVSINAVDTFFPGGSPPQKVEWLSVSLPSLEKGEHFSRERYSFYPASENADF